MNDVDLARKLRAGQPDLRVPYMSSYSNELLNRSAVLESGTDVLSKPFAVDTLTVKVGEMLKDGQRASSPRAADLDQPAVDVSRRPAPVEFDAMSLRDPQ